MGMEDKLMLLMWLILRCRCHKKDPPYRWIEDHEQVVIFGACMTGCRNNSKTPLINYLYLAQHYGAVILAEQEVYDVTPIETLDGARLRNFIKKQAQ
jgi:hypothetical protein